MRGLEKQVLNGEISYSRMIEILNERLSLPESKNTVIDEDFKKCKKLLVNRDEHLNAKIKECKEKDTRIQELEGKLKD